jgi:phosphate transport system protein
MDMGLEKLNSLLLEMATISEDAVSTSIEAYLKGEKGSHVRKWSDQLRSLHHQVSELSMEMIARYQPVASDLRFIKACIEVSYGFFRYGRYARDIVEVLEMFGDMSKCDQKAVVETSKKTQEMIRGSKLVEIPGAGHIPHIERSEAFDQALLAFLAE